MGCWREAVAIGVPAAVSDPRSGHSLRSQAAAVQHGTLSQRGYLQGGGWRVPLHLPLPLHRQALRDRYGPLAPTREGEAAVVLSLLSSRLPSAPR